MQDWKLPNHILLAVFPAKIQVTPDIMKWKICFLDPLYPNLLPSVTSSFEKTVWWQIS